jgi:hypothetical protein
MDKSAQSIWQVILPSLCSPEDYGLSDAEAGLLYRMWQSAPKGEKKLNATAADGRSLVLLKAKGYVEGGGLDAVLTEKGRKVIVEMATHEPNAFEKNGNEVSYNKIKAKRKSDAREKQAFVKRKASKQVKPFNLREERSLGN